MALASIPPALDWPIQFCALVTVLTYVSSIITSNVSQVDRLWTFLPVIYTAYYALLPLWPETQPFPFIPYTPTSLGRDAINLFSPRALLMLSLVTLWMYRLSYNTWRRGLFSLKDEDYRWMILRTKLPPWFFQVVNFFFVSIIQNILLLLLGLPTAVASTMQPHEPLSNSDILMGALALVILALEFTADNQQYAFQSYKHAFFAKEEGRSSVEPYNEKKQWPGARLGWTSADARRGFITRGLWAYSRHPNFFCEQSFWWIINLLPLIARPPPSALRVSPHQFIHALTHANELKSLVTSLAPDIMYILPAASLSLLFYSSTLFTESISKSKYPEAYAAYQKRVAMFDPWKTLRKGIVHRFFKTEVERKKIDNLVWGNVQDTKKAH
ncbi:hypothetical protein AX15_001510 [Amanita polypyramis BW_CC]|nr:hypothetical protein AX15_001510 [Amanita polypyramis BW_CC]